MSIFGTGLFFFGQQKFQTKTETAASGLERYTRRRKGNITNLPCSQLPQFLRLPVGERNH